MHSFTPVLNNIKRTADVGILYDPKRKEEQDLAIRWQDNLQTISKYRTRRNYPYLGKLNGQASSNRLLFSAKNYLGLELEINHLFLGNAKLKEHMQNMVVQSFWNVMSK